MEKSFMVNLLYNIPSSLLFFLICLSFITVSVLTTLLIHRKISLHFRYRENPAIICVSAIIGIIYAILVGFTVLYELDNYDKADRAENEEAKTMFSLFRKAQALPEPMASSVRTKAIAYAQNVIDNEWPSMEQGLTVNNTGSSILENIARELRSFKVNTSTETNANQAAELALINELAIETNVLFDAHSDRISKVHTALTSNLWFVLILGTFLTLSINYILGMEVRLHLACVTAISLMVSAVIFLVVTLDRPYRGDFSVHPNTFRATLEYLK